MCIYLGFFVFHGIKCIRLLISDKAIWFQRKEEGEKTKRKEIRKGQKGSKGTTLSDNYFVLFSSFICVFVLEVHLLNTLRL